MATKGSGWQASSGHPPDCPSLVRTKKINRLVLADQQGLGIDDNGSAIGYGPRQSAQMGVLTLGDDDPPLTQHKALRQFGLFAARREIPQHRCL